MICFPNCKINIGLYVTERRADGYHNLETVFYPVSPIPSTSKAHKDSPESGGMVNDVLEIVPAAETTIITSGLPISGSAADNLVLKAWNLLKEQYPTQVQPVGIYLHKIIPMGAGLGGGSADGAFMLRLLNDHFALGLSQAQLAAFALPLGSDCPFFIYNQPGFASGRGELFTPVALDLSGYSIQLICPQVHISTAGAFRLLSPRPAPYDLSQLALLPIDQWKDKVSNDFETPIFAQQPALANIKQQLYDEGAIYAAMSGTGSTIYGIFAKGGKADIVSPLPFTSFYIG